MLTRDFLHDVPPLFHLVPLCEVGVWDLTRMVGWGVEGWGSSDPW